MSGPLPLVSIIIPCYNGAGYVAEAIESALGQTYPNTEVVVVDDGSTDETPEVLRSFGSQIRVDTGPNQGGSAARNRGIEIARGELIQFLDADDLLHSDKLEKQVPVLLKYPDAFVCCGWRVVRPDGGSGGVLYPKQEESELLLAVLRGLLYIPSPLHWRRNLIRIGGFDSALSCCQELDLHLRLACTGMEMVVLKEALVTVRRRLDSVGSDERRVALTLHGPLLRAVELLRSNGGLTESRRLALARRLAWLGREHVRMGERQKAAQIFTDAGDLHHGAIQSTYSGAARLLCRILGPVATERLGMLRIRRRNGR